MSYSVSFLNSCPPPYQPPVLDFYNEEENQEKNNQKMNGYIKSLYKKVRENPEKLGEVVANLKRLEDSEIFVSHLFYIEILDDHLKVSNITFPCSLLIHTLEAFDSCDGFLDLMTLYPYHYANGIYLLSMEIDCQVKKTFFEKLVKVDGWQEQLEYILITIHDNPFKTVIEGLDWNFYHDTQLSSLNHEKMKEFIIHMAHSSRIDCFAQILYTLNDELLDLALRTFTLFSLEECRCRELSLHLSHPSRFNASIPLFCKMVEICRTSCLIEILFYNFYSFTVSAQAHFLILLSERECEIIIQNCTEFEHLYFLLNQIFAIDITYSTRKRLFKAIYAQCERLKNTKELISLLNMYQSPAIPYLLVALTQEQTTCILTEMSPVTRTTLFLKCKPTILDIDLIEDLLANHSLCETLLGMLPFEFSTIHFIEDQCLQNSELMTVMSALTFIREYTDESGSSLYLLDKIPPIMVRIACRDKNVVKILLRSVEHLTDDQLLFAVMSFPANEVFDYMESLTFRLKSHQYGQILSVLSPPQIFAYSFRKFEAVIARFENFKYALTDLLNELEESENLESFTQKHLEQLILKAYDLQAKAAKIVDRNTRALNQYLNFNYLAFQIHSTDFQTVLSQIEGSRSLIANKNSYFFARLAVIEKKIQKEFTDFVL